MRRRDSGGAIKLSHAQVYSILDADHETADQIHRFYHEYASFPCLPYIREHSMVIAGKTAKPDEPGKSQLQVGSSGVKKGSCRAQSDRKGKGKDTGKAKQKPPKDKDSAPGNDDDDDDRPCYRLSFNLFKLLAIAPRESCLEKCQSALERLHENWGWTIHATLRRHTCIRSKNMCFRLRAARLVSCQSDSSSASCLQVWNCRCSTQVTIFRIWQPPQDDWMRIDAPHYHCTPYKVFKSVMKKVPSQWSKDQGLGYTVADDIFCKVQDSEESTCSCAPRGREESDPAFDHSICMLYGHDTIPEEPLPVRNEADTPVYREFGDLIPVENTIPGGAAGDGGDAGPGETACGLL